MMPGVLGVFPMSKTVVYRHARTGHPWRGVYCSIEPRYFKGRTSKEERYQKRSRLVCLYPRVLSRIPFRESLRLYEGTRHPGRTTNGHKAVRSASGGSPVAEVAP